MDAEAQSHLRKISHLFKMMSPHSKIFRLDPAYLTPAGKHMFPAVRDALESVSHGQSLTRLQLYEMGREFFRAAEKNDPLSPRKNSRFEALKDVYQTVLSIHDHLAAIDPEGVRKTGTDRDRHILNNLSGYTPPPHRLRGPGQMGD